VMASAYHAGRTNTERAFVQERFVRGESNVMVATNAFGLGIDKPDIRHVIHTDLALTLEAYYQEAGRAGRDGKESVCTLLYTKEDRRLMDFFIQCAYPEPKLIDEVVSYLFNRAATSASNEMRELSVDENSIAVDLHRPVGAVKGVVSALERAGSLLRTAPGGLAVLRMRSTMERLSEFVDNAPVERQAALRAIERLLAQRAVGQEFEFSLQSFLQRSGISITEFTNSIQALHAARILRYSSPTKAGGLVLLVQRPLRGRDLVDIDAISARRNHAQSKLDVMIRYVETKQCKRNFILNYFNDTTVAGECGKCSSCTKQEEDFVAPTDDADVVAALVKAAFEVGGRFGRNTLVDVVTGTISNNVESYRLDRAVTWGACKDLSRSHVMRVLDEAVERDFLQRTGTEYPLITVGLQGRRLVPIPPKRLHLDHVSATKADPSVLTALISFRDSISEREEAVPTSMLSMAQLERLATDKPTRESELLPGNHGSAMFLAQHGKELVDVIGKSQTHQIVKIRADESTMRVANVVRAGGSLVDVARKLKQTTAATAQSIQRALEAGLEISRGELVADDIFVEVMEFMRHHRYAKLRHVREHLEASDVDLPTLRVAMAFARRELYGATEE